MYPSPSDFEPEHHTEVAITKLFKLIPGSTDYSEPNRVYLKSFLDGPINNDDKILAMHELSRVYYCYPITAYNPELSHYEMRQSVENDTGWTDLPLDQIVFQCQVLEMAVGCAHRVSAARLYCSECDEFYGCRFCHDESDVDHLLDVLALETIQCRKCQSVQPFNPQCHTCQQQFGLATQVCVPCKRLDFVGPNVRPSVHCDKCKRCYVEMPGHLIHCDSCNICVKASNFPSHKCSEMTCSVCLASIQTNFMSYITLNCGHYLHSVCRHQMIESGNYKCPICRRFILLEGEILAYSKQIRRINAFYAFHTDVQVQSDVECDECGKKFTGSGKVIYQCECKSLNTHVVTRNSFAPADYDELVKEFIEVFFEGEEWKYGSDCMVFALAYMELDQMDGMNFRKFKQLCGIDGDVEDQV